jgi:hypothetical protein
MNLWTKLRKVFGNEPPPAPPLLRNRPGGLAWIKGARKADDNYTVWGCAACHEWLDRGSAPAALKENTFREALARQVLAWRGIAQFDPFVKDKRAAQWALDLLDATPTGELG